MARKLVLLSCACAVRLADAATFTVLNTDDSGVGSLREAITLANADNTTPRMINFSAAGTITLTSALPQVTKFMTIDATTAPGYAGTPVVTIDGNSGDFDGLTVNAFFTGNANNKTFVKGLCIINCGMNGGTARNGITLVDGDSVTVSGCFIGINAAGTAAARNTGAGIRCELAVATIGGTGTNDRCVISGNLGAGIDGQTDGSNQGSPITVLNSYIGLGANGMTAVPNGGDGIRAVPSVSAAALTVGSTVAGSGNFISANGRCRHPHAAASDDQTEHDRPRRRRHDCARQHAGRNRDRRVGVGDRLWRRRRERRFREWRRWRARQLTFNQPKHDPRQLHRH
jgi:hypothetical protein